MSMVPGLIWQIFARHDYGNYDNIIYATYKVYIKTLLCVKLH